jgi:hypothetical protein
MSMKAILILALLLLAKHTTAAVDYFTFTLYNNGTAVAGCSAANQADTQALFGNTYGNLSTVYCQTQDAILKGVLLKTNGDTECTLDGWNPGTGCLIINLCCFDKTPMCRYNVLNCL